MGSEMCIRDRAREPAIADRFRSRLYRRRRARLVDRDLDEARQACLLYTSDAADERSSVDLGGRRIIKKKKIISRIVKVDTTRR